MTFARSHIVQKFVWLRRMRTAGQASSGTRSLVPAMKLVLLGAGGYYPTSRRHTACMMLPEVGVVLDAGTGMCRVGEFLQTERLDIFLSHAHLDHVTGLTCLLSVLPEVVQAASVVHGERAK